MDVHTEGTRPGPTSPHDSPYATTPAAHQQGTSADLAALSLLGPAD